MFAGRYKRRAISLEALRAPLFNFNSSYNGVGVGCGANALACITGASPHRFVKLNKGRSHYSDSFMLKILKKKGYIVVPLKWKELNSDPWPEYPIKKDHVVLFSQLMAKREGSWLVMYDDKICHNFESIYISPRLFFAKPILTAYIVWHPSWAHASSETTLEKIIKKYTMFT